VCVGVGVCVCVCVCVCVPMRRIVTLQAPQRNWVTAIWDYHSEDAGDLQFHAGKHTIYCVLVRGEYSCS